MSLTVNELPTNVSTYKQYLSKYGILSLLYTLEHFEKEENYLECSKIYKSIKNCERRLKTKLYTRVSQDCIDETLRVYRKQNKDITETNVIDTTIHYSEIIIHEVTNL